LFASAGLVGVSDAENGGRHDWFEEFGLIELCILKVWKERFQFSVN
jgi:hypothetical protein